MALYRMDFPIYPSLSQKYPYYTLFHPFWLVPESNFKVDCVTVALQIG
jgi:hypothetical protein